MYAIALSAFPSTSMAIPTIVMRFPLARDGSSYVSTLVSSPSLVFPFQMLEPMASPIRPPRIASAATWAARYSM